MPSDPQDTAPTSIAEWVKALFDELHDPQVLEVALKPGTGSATIECRGAGLLRSYTLPEPFVAGVLAKMKKLANLDVAERRREQRGRVRMLDFHGSVADFEVSTAPAGEDETVTLRRVIT
jgi:type II secretory ATPase GspE/PulE/Tfp pilus assembly ATPase PilB-like protein